MSALRPCSRQGMKTGRFPWHNQRLLPRTRIQAILFEWRGFLLSKRIMSQPRTNIRKPSTALALRSEEHTSELQSLMRISYAVFCLKKKNQQTYNIKH